jgi:hypothetical protein
VGGCGGATNPNYQKALEREEEKPHESCWETAPIVLEIFASYH